MTINLENIKAAGQRLTDRIVRTPLLELSNSKILTFLPNNCRVKMKLELFQHAGSFKARGVTLALDALTEKEKKPGRCNI